MKPGLRKLLGTLAAAAVLIGSASSAVAAEAPPKKPPPKNQPRKNVVKWAKYDAGLADAKGKGKPAVLVFADAQYKGPATFEGDALFKVLTDSGAIPVKVSQPVLRVPKNADAEKRKKLQEEFTAEGKKYQELVAKYGVNATPMIVFLAPDGDVMYRLPRPSEAQVQNVVANLGKLLEQFNAAKAAAAGQKPPEQPKPEEKKANEADKDAADGN